MNFDSHKYVSTLSDLPKGEHFVILEFSTIYHEGDERSRTHPGHGYPAHSEPIVKYIVYKTRELWEASIIERVKLRSASTTWTALIAKQATVSTTVSVNIT